MVGTKPTWVVGVYDASFVRRWGPLDPQRNPALPVVAADLRRATELLGQERPAQPADLLKYKPSEDVAGALVRLQTAPYVGIDIETTGLWPHEQGAQVLTVALWTPKVGVVLPIHWPGITSQKDLFEGWLRAFSGRLIAHNAQFELVWLLKLFGAQTVLSGKRWDDSMAAARIDHCRESPLSLDACARLHLGVWVKGVTEVDPLRWRTTSWAQFARYNLLDAAASYLLGDHFNVWEDETLEYQRLCQASVTVALMENAALPVDTPFLETQRNAQTQVVADSVDQARAIPEVLAWEHRTGKTLDLNSPEQVATFLGLPSATEEVLDAAPDHPLIPLVLQLRRAEKLRSTYLDGWLSALGGDCALHPRYSTMRVATGRLSSEHPNIQNVPKRRDKWIRSAIRPAADELILSLDYSQIELRVLAALSEETVLIQELWEGADLHTRWTDRVLALHPPTWDRLRQTYATRDEKKLRKALRDEVKRGITFALPYGASPKSPGRILSLPEGISERISAEFWEHYPTLKRWQRIQRDKYVASGAVVIPTTGRARHALLGGNEPINNTIQGSASDIVVAAMVRITKLALTQDDPYLLPRINVHDDLTFVVPAAHLTAYAATIGEEMVRIVYPHIQRVPYVLEAQAGPSWGDQTFVATYSSTDYGHRRERRPTSASSLSPKNVLGDAWGSLTFSGHSFGSTDEAPRLPPHIPLRRAYGGGEDHAGAHPGVHIPLRGNPGN
jgi:DNA polymerase I-like protein with 3'-5' exonuclease and polymerase domains